MLLSSCLGAAVGCESATSSLPRRRYGAASVIGDAHFRAGAANSCSYPLLTFKCLPLCDHGKKRKFVICAKEGHNAQESTVFSFVFFCNKGGGVPMQRMRKIGVMTNSSPLLTLNAEGGGGDCLFVVGISSWFLHARFNRIDCVFF